LLTVTKKAIYLTGISKIRKQIASVFAIIFISSILIKPVHIFLPNHNGNCISGHNHEKSASGTHHKECNICNFAFSAYTLQKHQELTPPVNLPYIKLSVKEYKVYTNKLLQYKLLRAPPYSL